MQLNLFGSYYLGILVHIFHRSDCVCFCASLTRLASSMPLMTHNYQRIVTSNLQAAGNPKPTKNTVTKAGPNLNGVNYQQLLINHNVEEHTLGCSLGGKPATI
jgi:hypothetical protein